MKTDMRKETTSKVYYALKAVDIYKIGNWILTGNKDFLTDAIGRVFRFKVYGIINSKDFTIILFTVNNSHHSFKTIPLNV